VNGDAKAQKFIAAAADHGRYTLEGDFKACNEAYDRVVLSATELRKSEDGGRASFEGLLIHPDMSVRLCAAAYLLRHNESAALKTLNEVASGSGLVAFDAEMTAKEWKAGRLKLL